MTGLVFSSSLADQGGPLDWAKVFLIKQNCLLESLTALNKSAAAIYIQMFDSPRKLAVPITDTDMTTGDITAPAHGFVTGDRVTLSGIATLTSGYIWVNSADTFRLFTTRAEALAETGSGLSLLPDGDDDTGTLHLFSNNASAPVCEEYPLLAAANAPSNLISYVNGRFKRGLYVRAVTAVNGSTIISGDDVKYTPRYRLGDVGGPVSYED